jgi:hypothetical protein
MKTSQKTKSTSPSGTPVIFTYKGAGGGIWTPNKLAISPIKSFFAASFSLFFLKDLFGFVEEAFS